MELYNSKQDLINDCEMGEYGVSIIAMPVYSEDGELIGFEKEYIV